MRRRFFLSTIKQSEDTDDLVLVVGESNAGDTNASNSYGPTTPAGVALKWNGSGVTDVASTDFNNTAGTHGTMWKQFCLTNYNKTGRNTIVINQAASGSEFYPNGDNNNWYTSGTLYASMQTEVTNALAFTGKANLDLIVVWLGTNDILSANTTTDIQTGITSLFTRLMSDYPGVRILVQSTAVDGLTLTMTARKIFMKQAFRNLEDTYTDIELFANAGSYAQRGYTDGIHFTQDGYNAAGDQAARCFVSPYSKQTRVTLSQYDTELDSTKEAAWDTFITWCIANNCWKTTTLDKLQIFVADTDKNMWNDFTNCQTPLRENADFHVKEGIGINGSTSKRIVDNLLSVGGLRNTTVTDFYDGIKVVVNSIPGGTAAVMAEDATAGVRLRMFQTVTPSIIINTYTSSNMTHTATITAFQNNAFYAWGRGGTTEEFLQNAVVLQTRTSTAGTVSGDPLSYGGISGTYWTGKIGCLYRLKRTGVTLSSFESQLNTLLTALAV